MSRPRARSAFDLAGYLASRALLGLLALLPRRAGLTVGRALGRLFYVASPAHRRVALLNLSRAFGARLEPRRARRLALASFAHTGSIIADAAYFGRLVRMPTGRLAVYEGVEHLLAAQREGRGVLVFSGHFGHWELVALLQNRIGVPMSMVVRPLNNARLDRFLTRLRGLSGNVVIPKRMAARGVLRGLRDGRAIALLIDQNVRGDAGLFVDFFGIPAATTPSLATFALKSGAPIVPVFSYPLPDGRLRISYRPALRPSRRGSLQEDIRRITRDCTRILEEEIRLRPELWLWMHNRWRTRPPAPGPHPGPAGPATERDRRVAASPLASPRAGPGGARATS